MLPREMEAENVFVTCQVLSRDRTRVRGKACQFPPPQVAGLTLPEDKQGRALPTTLWLFQLAPKSWGAAPCFSDFTFLLWSLTSSQCLGDILLTQCVCVCPDFSTTSGNFFFQVRAFLCAICCLKLAKLASNLLQSFCLSLPSALVPGISYFTKWLRVFVGGGSLFVCLCFHFGSIESISACSVQKD